MRRCLLLTLTMVVTSCGAPRSERQPSAHASSAEPKSVRELAPLPTHASSISSIAVSPSDARIASASQDRTVKIWKASSGTLEQTIVTGEHPVNQLAFVDESSFVAASDDGTIRFWNIQGESTTRSVRAHQGAFALQVAPDGRHALTMSIDTSEREADGRQPVKLWDLSRLAFDRVVARVPAGAARLRWSADGRYALVSTYRAADGTWLVDVPTGKLVRRFDALSENAVETLLFDNESRHVVIGHAGGPSAVYDLATGALRERIEESTAVAEMAFEGRVVSLKKEGLEVRHLGHFAELRLGDRTVEGGGAVPLALTHDGKRLIVGAPSGIREIELAPGMRQRVVGGGVIGVSAVAIGSDGRTVARVLAQSVPQSGPRSTIELVDLSTGARIRTLGEGEPGFVEHVAFGADATRLIDVVRSNDGNGQFVRLWDTTSGIVKAKAQAADFVTSLTPVRNGRSVLVETFRGLMRVDAGTFELQNDYGPVVRRSAISGDGRELALKRTTSSIELVNVERQAETLRSRSRLGHRSR